MKKVIVVVSVFALIVNPIASFATPSSVVRSSTTSIKNKTAALVLTPTNPVEVTKTGNDSMGKLVKLGLKLEVLADEAGNGSHVYLSGSIDASSGTKIQTGKKVNLGSYEGPWQVMSEGDRFEILDSHGNAVNPSQFQNAGIECAGSAVSEKQNDMCESVERSEDDRSVASLSIPGMGPCGVTCEDSTYFGWSTDGSDTPSHCLRCAFYCYKEGGQGFWIWFAITVCDGKLRGIEI